MLIPCFISEDEMFRCSILSVTFRMGVVYDITYIRLHMMRALRFH